VVIGETAEVGNDVLMYQGVVLGGTTLEKKKRHPTIGNRVVLGAGAVALGAITIGDDARIGSGSVVVKSVPPRATVVGVPGRIVEDQRKLVEDLLQHGKLPDPVAGAIGLLLKEQEELRKRIGRLEDSSGIVAPKDELEERSRAIMREFSCGGGI